MSCSIIDICNMSLGQAGSSQQIHELEFSDDETVPKEARLCKLYWPLTFDVVARSHDWKCLQVPADISAALTTTPAWGYDYAYSLPPDCLRVIRMEDLDSRWTPAGRLLYTDETEVKILYIRRTNDTSLYDACLVEALVLRMGAFLSMALPSSETQQEQLKIWYERVCLPLGRFVDSAEQSPETIQATTWTNSRR